MFRGVAAAAVIGGLTALVGVVLTGGEAPVPAHTVAVLPIAAERPPVDSYAARPAEPAAVLAPHLADVAVDGAVHVDADGRLIFDQDLRLLLEHVLGQAAEPDRRAREALEVYLRGQKLPETVIAQVLSALDRYLDYRRAAAKLASSSMSSDDIAARLEALHALRREVLGVEMAEGFFGAEEVYDRYTLERLRVLRDSRLSTDQRRQQLELLDQQLPLELLAARRSAQRVLDLRERTQALRAAGASDADIYQLRVQQVGAEAAERLARVDQRRAEWSRRLEEYRRARDSILGNRGLGEADKRRAVEELLSRSFETHEAARVRALERIGELGS